MIERHGDLCAASLYAKMNTVGPPDGYAALLADGLQRSNTKGLGTGWRQGITRCDAGCQ